MADSFAGDENETALLNVIGAALAILGGLGLLVGVGMLLARLAGNEFPVAFSVSTLLSSAAMIAIGLVMRTLAAVDRNVRAIRARLESPEGRGGAP